MKSKVYIETTIISYLTALRSHLLVVAGNQETTRNWWDEQRRKFDIFISEVVIEEASKGDADASQRRLETIRRIPVLDVTNKARDLAKQLIIGIPLPVRAEIDALHIAIATVHGMDYLLTWNCKHIANATLRQRIETVCRSAGYEAPIICMPFELMEE